jgi:hypothetical protein
MDTIIDSFKSIEQINCLNYNYGNIINQTGTDLSTDNRLAVSTSKCLFLFNLNLSNKKTRPNSDSIVTGSVKVPIDFNNVFYYLKIIETPKICAKYEQLVKTYYNLNLNSKQRIKKRKSLRNQSKIHEFDQDDDDDDLNVDEKDLNDDVYLKKNLFDRDFIQLLSSFNQSFSSQQPDSVNNLAGFTLCKWNRTSERIMLAAITRNHQVVLYFFSNDSGDLFFLLKLLRLANGLDFLGIFSEFHKIAIEKREAQGLRFFTQSHSQTYYSSGKICELD